MTAEEEGGFQLPPPPPRTLSESNWIKNTESIHGQTTQKRENTAEVLRIK